MQSKGYWLEFLDFTSFVGDARRSRGLARQIACNVGEDGSVVTGNILILQRERGFIRATGGICEHATC